MKKEITCTVCPRGCTVTVEGEGKTVTSVEGYGCKRGLAFAKAEFTDPVRLLTTTVKLEGGKSGLLPVRSRTPIPRDRLFDCMEAVRRVSVRAPVRQYDVIIADVCGTGVDIVASKSED